MPVARINAQRQNAVMLAMMVGLALSWSPSSFAIVMQRAEPQEATAAVDTIRTKDGRLHAGKILSETARGYLFHNEQSGDTYVIEFETIQDLSRASDKPAPPPQPAPSPVLVPQPSAAEQAKAIARASELRTEIVQLRLDLEDATLAGPIVKLTFSGIATALTFVFLALHVNTPPPPRYDHPDTRGQLALAAVIAGTVAVVNGIWGGLQLLIRLRAREEIPKQIQAREAELAVLESGGTTQLRNDSRR